MNVTRYIKIQAVKLKDNELVPIWDSRITYEKSDNYGEMLKFDGLRNDIFEVIECVYDLKTRTLSAGIEIDFYPSDKDKEFTIGETVYYEKIGCHRKLEETSIVDILYEDYDLSIYKGKKIDKWLVEKLKDVIIDKDSMYAIKHWKPTYVLANGVKTEWSHELFHKLVK